MIPKKAAGGEIKYKFEEMDVGKDWIIAKNYNHARSIRVCAIKRGFRSCIRTVDGEIRVYLVGGR